MDPYESTSSIPNSNGDYVEVDYDQLEESRTPPPLDLYGVLNVSKEATEEEIKDAYKRLCRTFHPDKHVNPENKKAAESKFQVIQKAYEGKIIYDMFGEEGLSTSWEVGPRSKTPQELREEFERQAKLKKLQEVENMVKAKGDLQLNIDASQVFDPYDSRSRRRNRFSIFNIQNIIENTEVTQLSMKHSFQTQLQPQTQAVVVGQTLLRNGIGGGNIVGTLRHSFSPKVWAEVGSSIIQPRIVTAKASYSIDTDSFVIVSSHSDSIYSPPNLVFTGGRVLGKNTTGYLTYKTGAWSLGPWGANGMYSRREKSAVAISINGSYERSGYSFEIQTGIGQVYVSLQYNQKLFDDYLIKTSTTLSTSSGLTVILLGERKFTEYTKASLAVECGIPNGVTFKCRRLAALRELHAEHIENRKREAIEAIQLLLPSVERKTEVEKEKEGLVILEAWYGNISSLSEVPLNEKSDVIDARIPIQALVHDSQLTIPGGYSKSNIMGFYDPCMGERKQLKIKYQFQRKLHEVIVDDTAPVACPLRSHIIPTY
ncbi:hypothetical protein C1645_740555 [Glomus cerebriforme]|uniref:J domain-containing protein n=1 Tax=Glomus cerebriforme TaxID=658196 RepID=A0A397SL17_9GLOM|nr:hypothetical protein C1645_740555 [Glomus cerebriforme]